VSPCEREKDSGAPQRASAGIKNDLKAERSSATLGSGSYQTKAAATPAQVRVTTTAIIVCTHCLMN